VTADAHHVAQRDLFIEARRLDPILGELADIGVLAADVIELEHNGVRLAAVCAGMTLEVVKDVLFGAQAPALECSARLLAMKITPFNEVLAKAAPATPLSPAERAERQGDCRSGRNAVRR
jgi:hypothetical protein